MFVDGREVRGNRNREFRWALGEIELESPILTRSQLGGSSDSRALLRDHAGWSAERYEKWLAATLAAALLPD